MVVSGQSAKLNVVFVKFDLLDVCQMYHSYNIFYSTFSLCIILISHKYMEIIITASQLAQFIIGYRISLN